MSVIVLKDEDELKEKFVEFLKLVIDMRKKQKFYEIHFGRAKYNKKDAEQKVDEFLNDLATKRKSGSEITLTVKDE